MYIRSVLTLRGGADQASLALWVETLGGVAQEGRKFPHLQQCLEREGEACSRCHFLKSFGEKLPGGHLLPALPKREELMEE